MRLVLGFPITLIAILVSETWSSSTPTCYEPTSGLGPPLQSQSCMETGLTLMEEYPFDSYTLVHYKTDSPAYIQCPLKIERGGCLFTLQFAGATGRVRIDQKVIVDAILVILFDCVDNENSDGGEIVDPVGGNTRIRYTLRHPNKLTGNNATLLGDSKLNDTYISPANSKARLSMSGDSNPSFMVPSK